MKTRVILACMVLWAGVGCWGPTVTIDPAKTKIDGPTDTTIEVVPPEEYRLRRQIAPGAMLLPDGAEIVQCSELADAPPIVEAWPAGEVIQAAEFVGTDGLTDTYVVEGKEFQVPRGSRVTIRRSQGASGEASSASLHTNARDAESITQNFKAETPDLRLPGVGSSRGGDVAMTLKALISKPILFFYFLGAALIVGGVVVWIWLKMPSLGLACGVSGIAIIAVGVLVNEFAWVFLVAAVGLLAVGGVLLWKLLASKKTEATLTTVVAAVEKVPDAVVPTGSKGQTVTVPIAQTVKDAIAAEAGVKLQQVKAYVRRVKTKAGLGA